MSYKWKPSKTARREFASKMNDDNFAAEYHTRKQAKADKRRAQSRFDYDTAGGQFIPTKAQYDYSMNAVLTQDLSIEQMDACNQVIYGFNCQERIDHDFIHVVNELIRSKELV
jgi:hypothetical protein